MMREVMKYGGGVFLLLLVGLGCGTTDWIKERLSRRNTTPPTPLEQPPTPPNPVLPAKTPTLSEHKQPEVEAITQYNLAIQREANGKLPEAVALYQKAADQKLREAEYNVGYMYAHGEGLPQSDVNAALWFQKAADQGLPVAQHMMGFLYAEGRGVPESFAKALDWHSKAAEQGFADAQSHLGYLYAVGETVEANPTEAAKWFLRAAENGVINSQFQIGVFLARGDGIEQDVVEGYKWLHIASFRKHEGAQAAREELRGHMSSAQITEAQTRSGDYIAKEQQK